MTIDKTNSKSPFVIGSTIPTPIVRQTFNSSTNWTVPNTVSGIWIHLAGGGAGGAGRTNTGTINGSGGAGGCGHFVYTPVTPGSTVGIIIGAGGSGGTSGVNMVTTATRFGNDGGETYVNTSGASYGAGAGRVGSAPNGDAFYFGTSFSGPIIGLTRQQVVFGSANQSPRRYVILGGTVSQEGGSVGGWNGYGAYSGNVTVPQASTYGGGGGANGTTNTGAVASGGASTLAGYNGGAGVGSGGGGGGAGISGNGGAGSGNNGGAGGAGGGGGGGAGSTAVNNTANGGAGGAGSVKIYY